MLKDGVYFALDEREYHAENRLSASAIKQIVESPTEYWFNSRLNPLFEEKKDGEIGGKTSVPKTDPEIEALKQKALFLQFLLEEK